MYLAFPDGSVPNIEIFHRYVEIAAQQNIGIDVAIFVEKTAKPLKPIELEIKFVAPKLAAVRNVSINNADTVHGPGDQTLVRFVIIVEEIFLHVGDGKLRNDRDAVVRFLSHEGRVVPEIF